MKLNVSIAQAAEDFYQRSFNYAMESHAAKGLEDFRILLEKDPSNAETYSQMGIFFIKCGNMSDALVAIREAIRLNPDVPAYYMHAGVAYYKQANYHQAIKLFRKATQLKRDYVEVYFRLANCYEMLNEPNLMAKACAAYRQLLYYEPDDLKSIIALGTAYGMSGNYDQSIAALERAEKISPEDPILYYNMGISFYYKGKYRKAISCYEKALAILPEFPQAKTNLGIAQRALNGSR
ncbi:MAG: tetratricopeptide repeat protein [Tannerellaceae bacterium]|jgi:tetratricopeptide (TPR) repeat protein|nr:tetratricopeptide repeat protein [Tannerellaceae bacterium]